MGDGEAPELVLGPLLRYAGDTEVTFWVETSRACRVEILGQPADTFEVEGHHYALVLVSDLPPGTTREYQVTLDGTVRWPEPGSPFPPSVVRTLDPARPLRIAFGSCRVAELPAPGRGRGRARHELEHGADAMRATAFGLCDRPPGSWPDGLLMIGDQVYADEVGPATRTFIEQRRDTGRPPGHQVKDFEEYCCLYREAWSEPAVRWLLSVVPTAMIFDDHDVHDDWNISAAWRRDYGAKPWWHERITGAYMSYWIYQHLGNLSPEDLREDETWRQVRQASDAAGILRDLARRADQTSDGSRWSFRRTWGRVRVVVIDSRAGRVLRGDIRQMVDDGEWAWGTDSVRGDFDHLVLATSVPLLLAAGIHGVEAWSEAVCAGAWGRRFAGVGERIRRAADLEHWAAFEASFANFERLLTGLATGAYGPGPASVTVISGDVHHSYLADVDFPAGTGPHAPVYQAVCSPIHNVLPNAFRRVQRVTTSRAGGLVGTTLARLAGVRRPGIRWRITRGPWFQNMIAALEFDGRSARLRLDGTAAGPDGTPRLEPVCHTELSPAAEPAA